MAVDPLWSDVVLALSCDAAPLVDRKGHLVEMNVTASIALGAKFGYGLAVSSIFSYPNCALVQGSQDFVFGTADFSIDLYAYIGLYSYVLPGSGCRNTFIRKGGDTDNFGAGGLTKDVFALRMLDSGHIQFTASEDGVTDHVAITSSGLVPSNAHAHLEVVRSGTTFTLYINGTAAGSATSSSPVSGYIGQRIMLGSRYNQTPGSITGYNFTIIDDVRITLAARDTADFTPPTSAFTGSVYVAPAPAEDPYWDSVVALLHMDALPLVDEKGHAVVSGSSVLVAPIYSRFGKSIKATGTTKPKITGHADFVWGSGNFTIEFCSTVPYDVQVLFRQAHGPGLFDAIEIARDISNGISLRMSSTGYNPDLEILTGVAPPDGVMCHYEVARNGGTVTLYLDGVAIGSAPFALALNPPASSAIEILPNSYGALDELRLTKGVARHTANFTPDTTAGVGYTTVAGITAIAALTAPSATTAGYLGATASLSAPAATVAATAFLGASYGAGTLTCPIATVTATATNVWESGVGGAGASTASAQLVMPVPTVTSLAVGLSGADITCPSPSLYSYGHDSTGENGLSYTLTAPTLEAHGGANARLALAMPTLEAAMSIVIVGNAALNCPSLDATATATVSGMANATLRLQSGGFDVVGYSGAVVSATIGKSTVTSTATMNGVGRAALKLPLFELSASGHTDNFGSAELVMPSAELGRQLQAWLISPAGTLTAVGTAVVTATYEAYAVNLRHDPKEKFPVDEVTRYTNFPFTHVVRYQNSYYGANSTGLYLLEGTTDDAEPIPFAIKTGTTDFGSPEKKTVASAYFSGRFGPASTIGIQSGEGTANSYSFSTPRNALAQNHRQVFGKGVKERYHALSVSGTGVCELDSIELDVRNSSRRI